LPFFYVLTFLDFNDSMASVWYKSILVDQKIRVQVSCQSGFDISGVCRVFDKEEAWVAMTTEVDNRQYNVWESSSPEEEVDQFQLLEEKVDSLIEKTMALKSENEALKEKLQTEEEKVSDLSSKIETLRSGRNDAKQKIMSLLEKMEQVSS